MRLLLGLLLISFFVIGYLFFKVNSVKPAPVVATQVPTIAPTLAPINADDLFQIVNEWRFQNDYPAYKKSEFACSVAEKRLPEVKNNWSHDGFSYEKYCKSCYLGENLAKGYIDAGTTLHKWLMSPSHKKNLTQDYTHSCIKCDNTHENYCVQIFANF